ncbi:DHA2 family efflux MFS transporter permease subunit [Herbiconiux sp. VKM Ac-2851]|uniref:DHA2 family efflux MFS transporter permease subunit n=1 Tax=Herbiconiux sp. VKM Ac-2851 TaxID=2739025 RepID=UPI001565A3B6|nr:DHA2 family efflux MFS transporter permease subunit [Herbiconiux sp. VKM Ac-2851]NQX34492.1 DHA2 family efflux MFS transporter permease subunit [Herbiconiux sp. VKM Ac-2851]
MKHPPRSLLLAILCGSLFLVSLDSTIVNVALPTIARELGSSVATLQWTVDAYLLVLAALLLLSGSLADRRGRKKVFAVGVIIFTTGSLLCSLAPTEHWLIVFRMFQAVGGSAMTPVALAILTNIFTGPTDRARAIGIWSAVSGAGIAAGPLVGGFLIDSVGWRSIFWINVPTGIAVAVLVIVLIPESRAATPRALDPIGQVLAILLMVSLVFSIIESPRLGFHSPIIYGTIALTVASLIGLIAYERRRPQPLIPLSLFQQRRFTVAFSIAILGFLAFGGLLFINTLYLQQALGLQAFQAGLLTLPLACATVVAAPLSGRLLSRYGGRRPLVVAGVGIGVGALLIIAAALSPNVLWLIGPYAVFGVGYGMLNAPVNDTAVSDLPDDQAGVAASLISTAKQTGSALGVAIAGAVIATHPGDDITAAFSARGWFAMLLIAACGVAIVALALPRAATPAPTAPPVRKPAVAVAP